MCIGWSLGNGINKLVIPTHIVHVYYGNTQLHLRPQVSKNVFSVADVDVHS